MVKDDEQRSGAEAKAAWEKPTLQELDMNSTAGMMMMGMDAPMQQMTSS